MRDPGTLRTRLALEAPVESADGAGGVVRNYATVATLWAELTPLSARERVAAAAAGADVTHRIRLRARADIGLRHRLRRGDRIFRIVALRDEDAAVRFLLIEAQEREA